MTRTLRKHPEKISPLSQAMNDLVAEGGYTLTSDDMFVFADEEAIDGRTPVASAVPDKTALARPNAEDRRHTYHQAPVPPRSDIARSLAHKRPGRRGL